MRCFSSPGLLLPCGRWRTLRSVGLPHSEILGSRPVCGSPRLIAAYHVLRRLPVPRHPPCALTRLISVSRCDSSTPHARQLSKNWCLVSGVRCPENPDTRHRKPSTDDQAWKVRATKSGAFHPGPDGPGYSALQKGGDPAAGSPTATLLRLRPSHRIDLRRLPPCGWPTGFGSLRLPWRDGRCVQGPGTYSPRRG